MKITIENTNKTVIVNGQQMRIWEGKTDTGIKVHCYIAAVAHDINLDRVKKRQFTNELKRLRAASAEIEAIPLKLII